MEMRKKKDYVSPEQQMNGESMYHEPEYKYVPPVGPGSKSVPPSGDWRDLPDGLIPPPKFAKE